MKQGALIFDEQADRYDIRFDLAPRRRPFRPAGADLSHPAACLLDFQRRDSSCRKK